MEAGDRNLCAERQETCLSAKTVARAPPANAFLEEVHRLARENREEVRRLFGNLVERIGLESDT